MYSGKIFNKETGLALANIPVSDGRNIVFTNTNGEYSLPGWEKSNTVSVQVLTDKHEDWFCFTGGKKGTYDFYITPVLGKNTFSFIHTSDTEIDKRDPVPFIPFIKNCADETSADFAVHTGDICRAKGLYRHKEIMNKETIGCPVRYVLGNHDSCEGDYGEQLYEQLYGPVWWSFDYGDVHFIVLSIWGGEFASGYTMKEQLLWLKNDIAVLAKNKPVMVLSHDGPPREYTFWSKEKDLSVNMKECNLIGWVFGHIHTNYHIVKEGITNICTTCPDCGGIDSSVAGIRSIKVENAENISSEMIYNGVTETTGDEALFSTKLSGNIEFSEPQIYCGDIIVGTMSDSLPSCSGVYRISSKTGEILWFFESRGGVRNTVAVDGDRVYAQDATGMFYCINAENGELIFEKELVFNGSAFTRNPVLCIGDVVIGGINKEIYAFHKITGELMWHFAAPWGSVSSARCVYDAETNSILLNSQWYSLICIEADTGKMRWEKKDILVWHRNSTPVVEDGKIYTCGEFEIGILDIKTGNIIMKKKVDTEFKTVGAPTIYKDTIFVPTAKLGVAAYDKNTLELSRLYETEHSRIFTVPYIFNEGKVQMVESNPIIMDDTLIFTACDGYIYFYEIETARLIKKIALKGPSLVKPIIDGEYIYAADFLGNVSKFKI